MPTPTQEQAKDLFKKLDKNSDGFVSVSELKKSVFGAYYNFNELDRNGDKKISIDELLAFMSSSRNS
ncbi:EF-hand domain-containing protein [Burkholderia ubonensis]|uniref:EF-hand domain-containing protein n=1 Tax=Burkholderia ubonensis TaxID=101571 RepID=UPI0009B39E18|nr:EF-hand domain-containing protein [Burkholderia ubonensis]